MNEGYSTLRTRLNDTTLWVLSVGLFILPFFLGGNRPLVWVSYSALLSLFALYYFTRLALGGIEPRTTSADIPGAFLLYFLTGLYMVVQILPIAGYLPSGLVALPDGVVPSRAISVSWGDTVLSLARWVNIGLVGYFSFQIAANSSRGRKFLRLLYLIVVAHAIYGLALRYEFGDTILFVEKWVYKGYVTGGFVNRNSFATFLAIGSILGLTIVRSRYLANLASGKKSVIDTVFGKDGIFLPVAGWLIIIAALMATASRMGLFAGMAGLIVTAALYMAKQGRQKRARKVPLYSVLGFIAVLLLFVLLYGLPLLERLAFIEQSSDVRAALYHQVWQMILARPLTGYGGGTFEYAFPLFHHAPVNIDQVWERAHSSYLGLWADYGLVFGSLPQLLILMLFLRQIRAYVRASDPDPVVITAIGATVTVALHSLVDFSLEIQGVTLLFAAITAAGASAAGNRKSRQASE